MSTQYGNPMIQRVIERFREEYGEPYRSEKYPTDWRLSPSFGVMVENNQPKTVANVWVPRIEGDYPKIKLVIPYPPDKTRHSATEQVPGLEFGNPCLMCKVDNEEDLEEVIRYIRSVCPIT